ncbi:MAG: ribonuclease H [Actinomycetaceae bacterium]|nr:ribonuclease H [Actinomycetaceae bacterium]
MIIAAADGSAIGNPGPTGWAWYVDEEHWAAGAFPTGTNNIGELTAVAELLEATAHVGQALHIVADSRYVIDSVTSWMPGWKRRGWKKADGKPVKNVDLMRRIDALMQGREVTFEWVRGHAGHPLNEKVDALAQAQARAVADCATRRGPGWPGQVACDIGDDTLF